MQNHVRPVRILAKDQNKKGKKGTDHVFGVPSKRGLSPFIHRFVGIPQGLSPFTNTPKTCFFDWIVILHIKVITSFADKTDQILYKPDPFSLILCQSRLNLT